MIIVNLSALEKQTTEHTKPQIHLHQNESRIQQLYPDFYLKF